MFKRTLISVAVLCVAAGTAWAEDKTPVQQQTQKQERIQEQIYGSQLMTPQERAEHRAKMRAAKTQQERDAIRLEHHKKMQERAKEKGITLPDTPPPRGGGMGPGGMGPGGMGPGGMGPGGMGPGGMGPGPR